MKKSVNFLRVNFLRFLLGRMFLAPVLARAKGNKEGIDQYEYHLSIYQWTLSLLPDHLSIRAASCLTDVRVREALWWIERTMNFDSENLGLIHCGIYGADEDNPQFTGQVDPWTSHLTILSLRNLVDEIGVRTFASRHQEDKICSVEMLCELWACQTVFKLN